jgi:hypothetical protein
MDGNIQRMSEVTKVKVPVKLSFGSLQCLEVKETRRKQQRSGRVVEGDKGRAKR